MAAELKKERKPVVAGTTSAGHPYARAAGLLGAIALASAGDAATQDIVGIALAPFQPATQEPEARVAHMVLIGSLVVAALLGQLSFRGACCVTTLMAAAIQGCVFVLLRGALPDVMHAAVGLSAYVIALVAHQQNLLTLFLCVRKNVAAGGWLAGIGKSLKYTAVGGVAYAVGFTIATDYSGHLSGTATDLVAMAGVGHACAALLVWYFL
jgi:hypothetical protein